MNNWNSAIQNYMDNQGSRIGSVLSTNESMDAAKSSLLGAKTAEDIGMAGSEFSDKLQEGSGKMAADMMVDLSAAGLVPQTLKYGAKLALGKYQQLQTTGWKVKQARRFAQEEGLDPDAAVGESEGTLRGMAGDLADNVRAGASDLATNIRTRVGGLVDNVTNQARTRVGGLADNIINRGRAAASGAADDVIDNAPRIVPGGRQGVAENVEFEDPVFENPLTTGVDIGEGAAGNVTRVGQMVRDIAAPGRSSVRLGQFLNSAQNRASALLRPSQVARQPVGPDETGTQRNILQDDPEEHITGGALREPTGTATVERPVPGEPAVPGEPVPPTEPTVRTLPEGYLENDADTAEGQARIAEREGGDVMANAVKDLAPELGDSMWGAVGDALGAAVPIVGWGLGAWALGEGIYDEVKNAKEEGSDPYAQVRGEIASTQGKLNNLSSNISADEFSSKIGAAMPSFGSMAARPNIQTNQMMNYALHV